MQCNKQKKSVESSVNDVENWSQRCVFFVFWTLSGLKVIDMKENFIMNHRLWDSPLNYSEMERHFLSNVRNTRYLFGKKYLLISYGRFKRSLFFLSWVFEGLQMCNCSIEIFANTRVNHCLLIFLHSYGNIQYWFAFYVNQICNS